MPNQFAIAFVGIDNHFKMQNAEYRIKAMLNYVITLHYKRSLQRTINAAHICTYLNIIPKKKKVMTCDIGHWT